MHEGVRYCKEKELERTGLQLNTEIVFGQTRRVAQSMKVTKYSVIKLEDTGPETSNEVGIRGLCSTDIMASKFMFHIVHQDWESYPVVTIGMK